MDVKVTTLDGKAAGKLTLADAIFGLEPREDILHRMVRFQMLKRMRGTHDVKNRAEVAFTTKKFGRQKGGGTARHGSRKSPIFRKGGRAFGPTPRSHAIELPKKVRAMALKHALSTKAKAGDLIVIDAVTAENAKTSALKVTFAKLGLADALFVGGAELDQNFAKAARNIPGIDVLPAQGINVYDILRRRTLVLSKAAVEALEARFA